MSIDDLIYAPIVPPDELRELVKKIMNNPSNRKILDQVSDRIVDLFGRHGIYDEQEIVDAVYRAIKDLETLGVVFMRFPRPSGRKLRFCGCNINDGRA